MTETTLRPEQAIRHFAIVIAARFGLPFCRISHKEHKEHKESQNEGISLRYMRSLWLRGSFATGSRISDLRLVAAVSN
jgi:hypothetical protein